MELRRLKKYESKKIIVMARTPGVPAVQIAVALKILFSSRRTNVTMQCTGLDVVRVFHVLILKEEKRILSATAICTAGIPGVFANILYHSLSLKLYVY